MRKYQLCCVLAITLVGVCLSLRFWRDRNVFDLARDPSQSNGLKMLIKYDASYEDKLFLLKADNVKSVLRECNHTAFPSCPAFRDTKQNKEFFSVSGFLYLFPKWMSFLSPEVLRIFRHGIYVQYCPFNEQLYLSEDCSELGLDYMYGLSISNIAPSLLGVDLEVLRLRMQNKGDTSDNWKYRGYHQDH